MVGLRLLLILVFLEFNVQLADRVLAEVFDRVPLPIVCIELSNKLG